MAEEDGLSGAAPLCPVHKRIDERGTLEMEIGGLNCLACTLQERVELLALLAPFADGSKDSVTVLREVAEFWTTHHGEGRVVASYPATQKAESKLQKQERQSCQNRD